MKKHLTLLLLLLTTIVGYSQKRDPKPINMRGPVAPVDLNYANYKGYTLKLNVPSTFEATVKSGGGTFSASSWAEDMVIYGLKHEIDGDFKIAYNVSKFEFLDSKSISRSPAFVMGIEANVEIKDKEGKVIYQRFQAPKVNTFIVDNNVRPYQVMYSVLYTTYKELINDFTLYYLYGPVLKAQYIELRLPKKTDLTDFNLSTQVFPSINGVSRDQWPNLFGEAQKYWETLLKYQTKDEDDTKDVRMAAAYNLAFSNLLLGNMPATEKYAAIVKENDRKFLGMASNNEQLVANIKTVKEYTTDSKEARNISPIAIAPALPEYKKAADVFKYVLLEGELLDNKGEKFTGKIKLMNDNPPVVDYRQNDGGGLTLGGVLSAFKTDNSSVQIEIEGQKKPVKRKIDDIAHIKTKDGKTYKVGVVGDVLQDSDRYALMEEVKIHPRLSVYNEVFPQSDWALKKPKEEKYYQIPAFTAKKSLKSYFADCPAMQKRIDTGEFNSVTGQNYINIFEAYLAACVKK
jgi:hypothetical protein